MADQTNTNELSNLGALNTGNTSTDEEPNVVEKEGFLKKVFNY